MQIGKVLSTRTPSQIKKHAECFFKQNLKTNSAAVKRYRESLSPDRKAPSFEEPSPPIGRVQSGFAASFIVESGNNVQANLPNNNINKGRWTEEEHKIFMQEYEKYGNNYMQIKKSSQHSITCSN